MTATRCTERLHVHRPCEGCGAPCGPDDGWRTTTGRVWVCGVCLERHRAAWMRDKAGRIAAVERVERGDAR